MDGFEVTVEALSDAGETGQRVTGDVAALPMAGAVAAVGDALPGSLAAAAAAALAGVWQAWVAATAEALTQYAAALHATGAGYEAAERAAVARLVGER